VASADDAVQFEIEIPDKAAPEKLTRLIARHAARSVTSGEQQ
jgi:hypothetical protein